MPVHFLQLSELVTQMLRSIWGSEGQRGLKEGLKEDCFIGQRKLV